VAPSAAGIAGGSIFEGTLDPALYVLGPGDVLTIGFWGEVNRIERVVVSPDGYILVAPVGPLNVDGMTLADAREVVKRELSPYYRPSILSVSLREIRTFQIHVVGMVNMPGAMMSNAVTRASQAITLAEGLLEGGSERNIVIRRGEETIRVDLTRYHNLGDNSANPFLANGDVVHVPARLGQVHVYGSVYRPTAYEFVAGETLADVIALAGGFSPEAYTETIEVERFEPDDPTQSQRFTVRGEPALLKSFEIMLDDRVFIRAIPDWHEDAKVLIKGEVKYPGVYVIEEGVETLSQVISRAGGLTEYASLAEARLVRGLYADTEYPIEGEIAALAEMQNSEYKKDRDLLKTMSRETKGQVSISFEEVLIGQRDGVDPVLLDGDVIDVPRASWSVRVSGHVREPGLVAFKPAEGHRYYIKQAGGFAPGADKNGTRIIKGTGGQRVRPDTEEIRPGDIVWVPAVPERDWWEFTRELVAVFAALATVYLVVDSSRQ
jgi:protein involved in polysaccharide export with SLBB domain